MEELSLAPLLHAKRKGRKYTDAERVLCDVINRLSCLQMASILFLKSFSDTGKGERWVKRVKRIRKFEGSRKKFKVIVEEWENEEWETQQRCQAGLRVQLRGMFYILKYWRWVCFEAKNHLYVHLCVNKEWVFNVFSWFVHFQASVPMLSWPYECTILLLILGTQ